MSKRKKGFGTFFKCVVMDLIVAAVLYFANESGLPWLCIVGFVLAGLNLITFLKARNYISVVAKILLGVFSYFVLVPKVLIPKGGEIATWLYGYGMTDIFYIARILAVVFVGAVFAELISNADAMHGD